MKKQTTKIVVLRNEAGLRILIAQSELVQREAMALLMASENIGEFNLFDGLRQKARDFRQSLESVLELKEGVKAL